LTFPQLVNRTDKNRSRSGSHCLRSDLRLEAVGRIPSYVDGVSVNRLSRRLRPGFGGSGCHFGGMRSFLQQRLGPNLAALLVVGHPFGRLWNKTCRLVLTQSR
jgi:hypothetical protein